MIKDDTAPIVLDNGSGACKVGFSAEDQPKYSIRTVVGTPLYNIGMVQKELYVGREIQPKPDLQLHYPVEHGIINNWNYMTKIWNQCVNNKLNVSPSQHPFLLTQIPRNPKQNRERMIEIMFDEFDAPAFYLANQPLLALFASGKTTGLVLESGDGVTHTAPIYEGCVVPHAVQRNDICGKDLTLFLGKLLNQAGVPEKVTKNLWTLEDIKEKVCYVSSNLNDQPSNNPTPYTLPDGKTINISGKNRYHCPEALFKPSLINKQMPGIHERCIQSVMKCDHQIRKQMYGNIVLSGGNTMFDKLSERLKEEISSLIPQSTKVKIYASSERNNLAWIGGSILSSLNTFQNIYITKSEYQEIGVTVVHKKCS